MDQFLDAHRIGPGCFSISGILHPISIRDQILRGQQFARRAIRSGLLTPNLPVNVDRREAPKFLIVGAGAAGVSAALEAAANKIPTLLVDRYRFPFSRQAKATSRYVDPTQYDWPLGHWQRGEYQWRAELEKCSFGWTTGDYANNLSMNWHKAFRKLERGPLQPYLRFRKLTNCYDVLPHDEGSKTRTAMLKTQKKEPHEEVASVILFSMGFGDERVGLDVPDAVQTIPFWSPDKALRPNLGVPGQWADAFSDKPARKPLRILISGGGDGGLQDFLRFAAKPSFTSARSIFEHVFRPNGVWLPWVAELAKTIQDNQDCCDRKLQWATGRRNDNHDHVVFGFLDSQFKVAVEGILDRLESDPRLDDRLESVFRNPLPEIYLIYRCSHFDRSYALNRFLVHLLAGYLEISAPPLTQDLNWINPNHQVISVRPAHRNKTNPWGDEHKFQLNTSKNCYEVDPGDEVDEFVADIVVIRHGANVKSQVPDALLPYLAPPRSRQLLPYNFLPW